MGGRERKKERGREGGEEKNTERERETERERNREREKEKEKEKGGLHFGVISLFSCVCHVHMHMSHATRACVAIMVASLKERKCVHERVCVR